MKKQTVPNQLSLRECKQFLTSIMDNYITELPVTVTVEHSDFIDTFELVPKNFKYKSHIMDIRIKRVSAAQIESAGDPGVYIAHSTFQMSSNQLVTNYYGLFVDPDRNRDLRYFDSESKCLEWLNKKIKTLNS